MTTSFWNFSIIAKYPFFVRKQALILLLAENPQLQHLTSL
mgnify:CR=1 FL=1